MNINSMLDLASTKNTTASKPSKGNSKTSDTLFQSILGQKSQGRDNTNTAVQKQGLTDTSKPQQTQTTPSKSDKPADINSDNSANDVENTTQTEGTDRTDSTEPTDSAETVDTDEAAVPAEEETGKIDDVADAEDGTEVASAANMLFIVVPGPIVATEVPKTVGPMEMVAAQPVFQVTEAAEGNQLQITDMAAETVLESAPQLVTDTDGAKTETAAPAVVSMDADVPEANLELDPELAQKLDVMEDVEQQPQRKQVTDDTVRTAAEGSVDHAEHFAAQVVKEAKSLVGNSGEQTLAPVEEEAVLVTDDEGAVRPVEGNEDSALVHEDLDPEPDAKEGTKAKETPVQHQNVTGTAHVMDNGRVDFRTSGAQPLEAQQVAAPPEPPQLVLNRVVDQVRSVVTPERTEFFVQLKPDHLGGLSIGLVAEDKGVVAKIMTSSQQVHAALQADMNQMVQMLRDKGINVVQMEIIYDQTANAMSQDQGDRGQQQFGQGHGHSHGRGTEQVDGTVSMYDTTLSSYEVLAEQGGSVEFSA